MKAIGNFVYKGLDKRSAGKFTNDKGQEVSYKEAYTLKVDENVDGNINERKLKVDVDNIGLVNGLKKLKLYEAFTLECEVVLYQNSAKVVPVALCSDSNNK